MRYRSGVTTLRMATSTPGTMLLRGRLHPSDIAHAHETHEIPHLTGAEFHTRHGMP
jgi:hypothetical protein